GTSAGGRWGREEDLAWARDTALRTLRVVRGHPGLTARSARLITVDDDLGGPHAPPSREALPAALRRAGIDLHDGGAPLVAVYSDTRAWKGRPGLSSGSAQRVRELLAAHPEATLLLFSHPRFHEQCAPARHILAAWG